MPARSTAGDVPAFPIELEEVYLRPSSFLEKNATSPVITGLFKYQQYARTT